MPDAVVDIGNSRDQVLPGRMRTLATPGPRAGDRRRRSVGRARHGVGCHVRSYLGCCLHAPRPSQAVRRIGSASRGDKVVAIDSPRKVPIGVSVDEPAKVGIDRLLNVLAASALVELGEPAIVVDAGSAVTVDLLHEQGSFAGGAIFPGLRLMALALREHTAQLPLVDATAPIPPGPPGKNTDAAMKLGIIYAVAGGIDAIIRETAIAMQRPPRSCS